MLKGRSLGRAIVLQTLFEIDTEGAWKENPDEVLMRNFAEFAGEEKLLPFIKTLLDLIIAKRSDLDKIIEKAAPQWPIDRIAIVDRNILRIGLAELLFSGEDNNVPPKVAINEAIELAKKFGAEKSPKFINGVLGAVYKEMGEPGKDDRNEAVKDEEVIAALCYAKDGDEFYLALVHDIFGYWTLVKGVQKEAETDEETLERKVKEEIGLDILEVEEELGRSSYKANNKEGLRVKRNVKYYLVKVPFEDLKLKSDGGLDDAKWFRLADVRDLRFYDDLLDIISNAINILLNK